MQQPPRPVIAPPPQFVGVKPGRDPVVSSYTAGLAQRAKAAGQAGKVPIPNLAAAAADYRPEKDGPMTLSGIAQAQENIRHMDTSEKPTSLRPETLAGLRALHDQTASQQQPPEPTPPPPTASSVETAPTPPASKDDKKSVTREREEDDGVADIDFDLMMQRVRSDVLNNEEERKAVEARVKEMQLADGLMTGEFKQLVPIKPGALEVLFRTISPMENDEIRRHVLTQVLEDEKLSNLMGERYGFMQTVAAIVSINGQEFPKHLRTQKGQVGHVFDWDVFNKKLATFMSYPTPLIHSLSTHAYWFDLRVRKLFSSTSLKNG